MMFYKLKRYHLKENRITRGGGILISTRGRYALRIMLDLAESGQGHNVSIHDIAIRQKLSEKYLEGIMRVLVKENYVKAERGRNGGYRISKSTQEYTVFDILSLTEKSLLAVACLNCHVNMCVNRENCKTLPMWKMFSDFVVDFFKSITLEDLCNGTVNKELIFQVKNK